MESGAAILLVNLAGCVPAAVVMEWETGFTGMGLSRFLVYPISIPSMLVVLPYAVWLSRRHFPEGRGWPLLTVRTLRLWAAYAAGAACMIIALRVL